jgi:hypothetical protein
VRGKEDGLSRTIKRHYQRSKMDATTSAAHDKVRTSMTISITDTEWEQLSPENFDTTTLLSAVDAVDEMRGDLNDGEDGSPPQLRSDLLKLHQLAMAVVNSGARHQVAELFDLAVELEDQVFGLMTSLEQVQKTLSQLTALYPESLSYADLDD